jgi:hypothetical protein
VYEVSDETNNGNTMTVAEAYRLKHKLGQSITWGNSNLNALQVEELTRLTADDYARIRKDYKEWQKRVTVIPTYGLLALMAGCAAAYYYLTIGWVKVAAVILGVTCLITALRREGHVEGYVQGYESGRDEGIHKALGIKPEEADEMRQFATDMKIDDMVVKGMDEREKGNQ